MLSLRLGVITLTGVIGGIVGLWGFHNTNSWSVWGDALHIFGDSVPYALALATLYLSIQRRIRLQTYIPLLNSAFLGFTAVWLIAQDVWRLLEPVPIGRNLLWFGIFELSCNALQLWFAKDLHEAHISAHVHRSQMLHLGVDVGGSAAVVLSGAIIWFTGWSSVDIFFTLLVAIVNAWAANECFWAPIRPHDHAHNHSH